MEPIQLGPLFVKAEVLPLVAAAIFIYAALRLRFRKAEEDVRHIPDAFLNVLFISLISWKLSYMLTDPVTVLHRPLVLLYFDGGSIGYGIAALLSGLYIWRLTRKRRIPFEAWLDAVPAGCFAALCGYYGVYAVLQQPVSVPHLIYAAAAVLLLVLYMAKDASARSMVQTQRGLLAAVLLFALFTLGENVWAKPQLGVMLEGIKPGQTAPEFELRTLDGKTVKLSDYRGKKVLLNFWASWCAPCRAEMPEMERFLQSAAGQEVAVLAVNLAHTEARKTDAADYAAKEGLTMTIPLDDDGAVSRSYRVIAYPTSYWIDAAGIVRDRVQGPMSEAAMNDYAAKLNEK
ncbi:TlpA family protein disulfide reductase [Paenibacillus hamazuiensis]|uniref:TlpA family protein disulfide reductase n=1 Tax=Paenibacillus hamazuiensis TaxID=2936508 RepID=UPI00200E6CC4|nr:TlpA disulfide reductase family protein [Paenibacillus hamazuiensis]